MKSTIPIILSLTILTGSCRIVAPISTTVTPPRSTSDPFDLAWEDRSIFLPGLVSSYRDTASELPGLSIYHLQLEIDEDLIHANGIEEVRYINNENVPLKDIRFRLFPNILGGDLQVSEVLENGSPVTPDYRLNNSLMVVPLTTPLEPGQSVILTVEFALRVPETVELNYGVLASTEGVLTLAHAYPMIPVFNEEGWNAELPPQFGDLTFTDMSFFIVKVTAPRDLTLVGVGRVISRIEIGQTQEVYFAAGPVRDFFLSASPDYTLESEHIGETLVNFYAPASMRAGVRQGLQVALNAIEDFNARYVLYPYTELDIVTTPTLALGIEYPGMIAIAGRIVAPGDVLFESTVAHEIGHQWFYNLIGNDQLKYPWLDESITQFLTWQYYLDEYGEPGASDFRQSLVNRWQRVEGREIPIGLPVLNYSGQEYGAIVYGRGPLFFEAIQQRMGQDVFDDFIRDFAESYSWDIATPGIFKTLAEDHCACDLTPLFDQWVSP